jgi:hypothetical protein
MAYGNIKVDPGLTVFQVRNYGSLDYCSGADGYKRGNVEGIMKNYPFWVTL